MFDTRISNQLGRWLASVRGGQPLAIVLGGSVNGLSFVRSLGRRGVPTLLVGTDKSVGMYTRFGKKLLLPDPDLDPEGWTSFFDFVADRVHEPPVVFATSDAFCMVLSELPGAVAAKYRFLVPDVETTRSIVDKRRQYAIATSAGVPIPATHFPESAEEIRCIRSEMSYPCILKPYEPRRARKRMSGKVAVVHSRECLASEFEKLDSQGIRVMVQEIIPGDDSSLFGYLAFWDRDGREGGWLTKRKLRQSSQFGDGSWQVTVEQPTVADLSRRLLQAFNYRGFVGVEFKYDRRDGSYRLMEINARTVSGNQLAISAGVDFPWIGYEHLTEAATDAGRACVFQRDVHYVHEEWDLNAYIRLRKSAGLTFRDWWQSVREAEAKAISAWDDPVPLLVTAGRVGISTTVQVGKQLVSTDSESQRAGRR